MNRGWQRDSYRHALAAKGVHTTNKYYSPKANPRFVVRDGKIYDLRQYVKPVQELTTAFIQQEPIETEPVKEVAKKNRLSSKPNRMKLRPGEEYVADEEFEKLVRQFEEEGEYKENPNINRLYKADKIDLNKYQGEWKQVSVKNEPWYQKGLGDIKAEYKLRKDGNLRWSCLG